MEDQHKNIEEIEQFLEGKLQGKALADFELRLQNDESLAARVALMKRLDDVLEDEQALNVQKAVQSFGTEFFDTEQSPKIAEQGRSVPLYRRPLMIAASIALLLAISYVFWLQMGTQTLSNQELYAAYYRPYEIKDAQRGDGGSNELFNQGIKAYQANDYQAALAAFREKLALSPSDMQTCFYLANAHLLQDPPDRDEAITYFQKIIAEENSIYVPRAQWYLALVFLKEERTAEAVKTLQSLLNSEDTKLANQAKELLEKLD